MSTITVDRKEFRAAVSIVRQTIERKSVPAMACIRIRGNRSLELSTTAWDAHTTVYTGRLDAGIPFDVCIPVERFALKLNRSDGELFTFDIDSGSNRVTLRGPANDPWVEYFDHQDPKDRPPLFDMKAALYTEVDRMPFVDALRSVIPAMSTDSTRFSLNGVCVDHHPLGLRMVASDGHRLHVRQTDIQIVGTTPESRPLIWSALFCTQAVRILNGSGGVFRFHTDGRKFGVVAGQIDVRGYAVDGEYPNWKQIVPKPLPVQAAFKRADMVQAIKDLDLERNEKVHIRTHREHIKLEAGDRSTVFGCSQSPGGFVAMLNSRYLRDAITAAPNTPLHIRSHPNSSKLGPIEIVSDGDAYTSVLMPMRP